MLRKWQKLSDPSGCKGYHLSEKIKAVLKFYAITQILVIISSFGVYLISSNYGIYAFSLSFTILPLIALSAIIVIDIKEPSRAE